MNRPFSAVCTFPLLPSPNGQRAEQRRWYLGDGATMICGTLNLNLVWASGATKVQIWDLVSNGRSTPQRLHIFCQRVRPRLALRREKVRDDCLRELGLCFHQATRATRAPSLSCVEPKLASPSDRSRNAGAAKRIHPSARLRALRSSCLSSWDLSRRVHSRWITGSTAW